MTSRRDFLMTTAGLIGAVAPLVARSQVRPCPPPQLSSGPSNEATTSCAPSNAPAYIQSMSPFQARAMSGTYAPSNGTSNLRSVVPSLWGDNDDIMRPWSGGAKSTTGTKMYVHGGGHGDSSNNGLYSFDFAGTTRPTGWVTDYTGVPNTSSDISVGSIGAPISVHTYDGMIDMGANIYRMGGATWPTGSTARQNFRYSKSAGTWTRLPSYPSGSFSGSTVGSAAHGKILSMEREGTYFSYAFYRIATNDWSARRDVGKQWINNGASAFDPATNTGLMVGASNGYGATCFSLGIDWSGENLTQTERSMPSVGGGASLIWDATAGRYWCFGGSGNTRTIYEIHPTTFAVTAHTLSGDLDSLVPETPYHGSFGRWVFMESWRAIGSVASRTAPAYVIRLP